MSNATALPDADDREYMTRTEFAALPSDVHHAVWAANAAKRVDAIPASGSAPRRYRRDQVHAIMRELEAARTGTAAKPVDNPGTARQATPAPAFAATGQGGQP